MYPMVVTHIGAEEKKYTQAKKDVLQAIKSFHDLSPQSQIQLSNELYEIVKVLTIYQIIQQGHSK